MTTELDFLNELANTEVTARGNYLLAGKGLAVIKGFKRSTTRDGDAAMLDLLILKVTPKTGNDGRPEPSNTPGEVATKLYMFEKGSRDKKAAIFSNFKKDLCAIDGSDPKTIKAEKLASMVKAGVPKNEEGKPVTESAFRGMLIGFDSYPARTKAGEMRTYHNLLPVQQDPKDVAKRVKLLDSNADAAAFL